MILSHRHGPCRAVCLRRREVDQRLAAAEPKGLAWHRRECDVDVDRPARVHERRRQRHDRQIEDDVDPLRGHDGRHLIEVRGVVRVQLEAGDQTSRHGQVRLVAREQVVHDDKPRGVLGDDALDQVTADEPGASSDEHVLAGEGQPWRLGAGTRRHRCGLLVQGYLEVLRHRTPMRTQALRASPLAPRGCGKAGWASMPWTTQPPAGNRRGRATCQSRLDDHPQPPRLPSVRLRQQRAGNHVRCSGCLQLLPVHERWIGSIRSGRRATSSTASPIA